LKSKADSRVDAPEFRDEKKPAHIVQLENLKTDYERLQARVASERAIRKALKDEPRQLLDEIALTLIRASEASNPVVGQVLDPDRVTRTVDGFPMPGASTSSARRADRKLLSDLHRAVQTYDAARSRNFTRRQDSSAPSLRCGIRQCARRGERVPAWNDKGKANAFCPGCGTRFPSPDTNESLTNH
jgi:hypothetical protein